MAIRIICEGCSQTIRVPDEAAGRKGKCPACGNVIHIPKEEARDGLEEGSGVDVPTVAAPRKEANGLGIASLILGILALLIAWIPLLGLLAWPLAGIGALLGLVGLVLAVHNRRWGTGSAIAGLATNGAAIVLALAVTLWAGRMLQDAANRGQLGELAGPSDVGPPKSPAPVEAATPPPPPKPDGTFAGQDRNQDGRLNADEIPEALRPRFALVDADGDGYVDRGEWDRAEAEAAPDAEARGKVIARRIFTAADDFVVDVWHNGRRVPDEKRQMVGENYGATSEKIEVEVREGDWLVFNVANNRLRWGGASYFGAAGVNDDPPSIAFVTDPSDPRWSYCDDPGRVPAFIAHPGYLADQSARAPENPWGGGDGEMKGRVPDWNGRPIWGRERTTWLKFVARPAPASIARAEPAPADPGGVPGTADTASAATKTSDSAPTAPEPTAPAPAVSLRRRATFEGHPALVYCVAVTPDGRKIVSSSAMDVDSGTGRPDPRTLIAWDIADAGKTRVVIPIRQSLMSIALTPDGKSVVAPVDNGISAFDLKSGRRRLAFPGPQRTSALSAAVSTDGQVAAGGFMTHEVILWNARTGKPLRTLKGHTSGVIALAFSPDGKRLASGGQDNSARLWDVATGRAEQVLATEGDDSPVTSVVFTPDGSRLLSTPSGASPRTWDVSTGRRLSTLGENEGLAFRAVCVSPDGHRLATAAFDAPQMKWAVVLWDAETGRRLASAIDADGQVNAVAFTPDGKAIASGGGPNVKLWEIVTAPGPDGAPAD